jgi:Protein of unknown function (DUF3288)
MVCNPNSAQNSDRFSLIFLILQIFPSIHCPLSTIPYPLITVPEQSKLPQRHPQENIDRAIVNQLLESDPKEPMALAELARLLIRYRGFPGAAEIQANLAGILTKWQLTEEELFAKTRELHNREQIYQVKAKKYQEQEDWN